MKIRNRQRPVSLRRWGITALAVLSICAGAVLLMIKLDFENVARSGINHEIGRLVGEDLKLLGDARVSIRPDFRVVVTDPIFASLEGGGPKEFLNASRIEAGLRIAPLLLGREEIASLHLHGPHISMDHVDAPVFLGSGMPGADKTDTAGRKTPVTIGITEGTLEFAGDAVISDLNLSIRPRTASAGISVKGDFVTGARRTFVELQLDDPQSLFSEGGSKGTLSFGFDTMAASVEADPSGAASESRVFTELRRVLDYLNVFGSGPLLVDGHFAVTPGAIRVSNATFSKGGIALQGNLDLRTTADTPIFPQVQMLQVSADAAISEAVHKVSSGNWSATPITTSWLNGLEIDLDLAGQDIAVGGAAFDAVAISLHTRDHNLSLDVAAQSETLGRLEARTAINPAAEVTLSASLSDASVSEIMQPISRRMQARLIGTLPMPEGALNAELKLAGQGDTAGEIFESLAGWVTASMVNGSLTGADVTATLETLAQGRQFMTKEKGPLIPAAGRTQFDLIEGQVGIEAGTVQISRLNIVGERLEIDMLGEVGLKSGAMYVMGNAQLSATPEPETEQVARNVDLPFGIGGTVFSPMLAAGVPQFEIARRSTVAPLTRPGSTIRN
ncbi:AsmA-like C-terminal region-containing protein [uncultured Roseobacter sp.]|uniref:AsmA family protein n=1 Tax=uncultured Roseobacter sp. TaxID=114847 RepID=UPI00260F88A3|nr:AsmA-like C-terminal region-containing protein [uncultured Roseobacter sp.]